MICVNRDVVNRTNLSTVRKIGFVRKGEVPKFLPPIFSEKNNLWLGKMTSARRSKDPTEALGSSYLFPCIISCT